VQTILGVFVGVLLLVVLAWMAIFGGVGAVLSRSRGGSVPAGLAWGAVLGPFGWLAVLWVTRAPEAPSNPLGEDPAPHYFSESGPAAVKERWDPWNR
jgi:hypothetical protein